MTIIFATGVPFIKQHRIDMYMDSISLMADTQMWDLSVLYNRQNDKVSDMLAERIIISDLYEFESRLKETCAKDNVYFVTNILSTHLNKIYKILKKYGVVIININKEGLAAWLSYRAAYKIGGNKTFKGLCSAFINNNTLLRTLYKRIFWGKAKYDYLLSSHNFFPEDSKKFIQIHNIKYDEYIHALNSKNPIGNDYILFIDAALANHPMFGHSSNELNRDAYIRSLNIYFDTLEKQYNLPLVISAHPKSSYTENDFNGRSIIKYKTPELIQHCKYILSHYSTSLVNAVLLYKPIKILSSSDLEHSSTRSSVLMGIEFANRLNLEIVDLDKPNYGEFFVDKVMYDRFIKNYIINANELDKSNQQLINIFFKTICKLK